MAKVSKNFMGGWHIKKNKRHRHGNTKYTIANFYTNGEIYKEVTGVYDEIKSFTDLQIPRYELPKENEMRFWPDNNWVKLVYTGG